MQGASRKLRTTQRPKKSIVYLYLWNASGILYLCNIRRNLKTWRIPRRIKGSSLHSSLIFRIENISLGRADNRKRFQRQTFFWVAPCTRLLHRDDGEPRKHTFRRRIKSLLCAFPIQGTRYQVRKVLRPDRHGGIVRLDEESNFAGWCIESGFDYAAPRILLL